MSDKTTKTKADLLKMLAEAVRNTQPQPASATQPEPTRDTQPELKRKTRPAGKRTAKIKKARAPADRERRRR